jgi:hypothetical protein
MTTRPVENLTRTGHLHRAVEVAHVDSALQHVAPVGAVTQIVGQPLKSGVQSVAAGTSMQPMTMPPHSALWIRRPGASWVSGWSVVS